MKRRGGLYSARVNQSRLIAEEADPDMESQVRQECDLSTLQGSKTALDSGAAASWTTGNVFSCGCLCSEMSVNDVKWHNTAKLVCFLFLFLAKATMIWIMWVSAQGIRT